jgi:polysaccharide export outer membrane protein
MLRLTTALVVLALVPIAVQAQEAAAREEGMTTAEIRIELPEGSGRDVAVEPSDRRVLIELPRGSRFPLDFQASSGGLIREGDVKPLGDERVIVELTLAAGYLARVSFESGALVLTFESRVGVGADAGGDAEDRYSLGADDKITITVHNHPELSSELTISREGKIAIPQIGEIDAAGLSPTQLESRLTELLGRSYLVDPKVDVAVEEYNSQWVMVTGEVPLAGRVPLRGGTRLKEVLSEAGGFKENSGQEILVSRKQGNSDDYVTISVERADFESGLRNPMLEHGDIVEVRRSKYCYIHGEVRAPGRVPIERETTLLMAITLVGGLTEWADRKSVRILYPDGHNPSEKVVNLRKIQDGKFPDPVLEGGERIVIKRRFF